MHKAISRILFYEKHSSICFSYNSMQRYVTQIENNDDKKGKVSNLKKYWLDKYVNYIKSYEATLSKNFPKTMGLYRMFVYGTQNYISDLKVYLVILKKHSLDGLDSLTRDEIQLAHSIHKDVIKAAPVILISLIPFTNYAIIPLAYFFPRQMLTHHFWTPEQKIDFTLYYYSQRFKYSRPLFHCMESKANHINDQILKTKWSGIIACLGSGGQPTVESMVSCIALFASSPYSLDTLESKHMNKLLGIHELSVWKPFRKQRLKERGLLIKRMDDAIIKEGGVNTMSVESLSWAVSFRGLNSVNMSTESMKDWLEQWILLSTSVDNSTLSLLLHGPILLAYNHINNLKLLYNK
ncbi:PREDICTED: LETM1 domain-containing protein 1 [Polistes dominula]|uniref:LETM1 domain-containing protein 1 n=1 Tax=Polistes dominula TaxID=743375 RepID=A0ABM1J9I4_POLDO|nr:PREDICTED: LETM1 domain-containing protein 1 [Polistes dominula]